MGKPTIAHFQPHEISQDKPFIATGDSFAIHEWSGSGPASLHVHYRDDEAWHVLEGSINFRFLDGEVEVRAGSTVFIPAGVAHTFETDDARYLIILTPRPRPDPRIARDARFEPSFRGISQVRI